MGIDFKVPDLGENVQSGDIVNVLVKEGDEISADQGVMEIETGKAVVELPCPFSGRVTKVHVHKGSKVKVGDPLITVEGNNAAAPGQNEIKPTAHTNRRPSQQSRSWPSRRRRANVGSGRQSRRSQGETTGPPRKAKKPAAETAAGLKKPAARQDSTRRSRHAPPGARAGCRSIRR